MPVTSFAVAAPSDLTRVAVAPATLRDQAWTIYYFSLDLS